MSNTLSPTGLPRRSAAWLAALTGLLLLFAGAACGGDDDDDSGATPTAQTSTAEPRDLTQSDLAKLIAEADIPEELADGKRIGKADAPLKIEAYEDFGCPHCLEFTAVIEPVVLKEYVATGKASFEYKYFPLRQATGVAAIAAQCAAEQDKFWEYHRGLFVAQAEANAKTGPPLSEAFGVAGLRDLAGEIGLDLTAWETCFQGDAAVAVVEAELRAANNLALPGTPSFVINGKVTPMPDNADDWRKVLDDLLE